MRKWAAELMSVTCLEYGINDDERDSVIMAIRKHVEDWPGKEVCIDSVAGHSGVGVDKVVPIMFALLHSGVMSCEPIGDDNVIRFRGKLADGSPAILNTGTAGEVRG